MIGTYPAILMNREIVIYFIYFKVIILKSKLTSSFTM
jgi:hypothetical protein